MKSFKNVSKWYQTRTNILGTDRWKSNCWLLRGRLGRWTSCDKLFSLIKRCAIKLRVHFNLNLCHITLSLMWNLLLFWKHQIKLSVILSVFIGDFYGKFENWRLIFCGFNDLFGIITNRNRCCRRNFSEIFLETRDKRVKTDRDQCNLKSQTRAEQKLKSGRWSETGNQNRK